MEQKRISFFIPSEWHRIATLKAKKQNKTFTAYLNELIFKDIKPELDKEENK